MKIGRLSKKFLDVMKREVDLNADLSQIAERKRVEAGVASKFRLDREDVSVIMKELEKKGYVKARRSKRKKVVYL